MSTPVLPVDELLRHGPWLYRLARDIVRDDDLARDLVQETWLVAMRSAPPDDEKLQPWLRGVVRNLARMSVRSAVRRRGREHACVDPDERDASPGEALEQLEAELLLSREVRRLGEPYRTTLLLLYVEGLSAVDVARRLDVSAGTVRWRHQHALAQLRRVLSEGDPERRRLRALLLPIGTAAVVQGGVELLRSKSLWVALVALALALSPWRGTSPTAQRRSSVVAATTSGSALAPPVRAAPIQAPAAALAGPGELLVVVTDRAGEPIPAASGSVDGLLVGHTAADGHLVVMPGADRALPEIGAIAIDATDFQPELVGYRLGELVRVRLEEVGSPPPASMAAPLEPTEEVGLAWAGPVAAEATVAARPAASPPAAAARPPRRPPCAPGQSGAANLNPIRKELLMMRRYRSPYAAVAAVVAALSQAGCATDDRDAVPERLETTAESDPSSGGRGDDHPDDDGHEDDGHDDDGHDDDGHDDDGHDDDGHDDDGHDDDGGGGDDGDDGGTCPGDPCEGFSNDGFLVATDCGTERSIETPTEPTCAGALARCQELAAEDPDRSILCEWVGDTTGPFAAELFRHEADPEAPQCDALAPPPECEPSPPRCDIPCGDDSPGTYRGFYCDEGAPFAETEGIGCQAALGSCALAAALDPGRDIVCEFNGQEIFRREVNQGSCVPEHGEPPFECDLPLPALCEGTHPCTADGTGLYRGNFCEVSGSIRTPDQTCVGALGNCILNASLDLTRSIRCQWRGEEIYRYEDEAGACEQYDPVCEAPAP